MSLVEMRDVTFHYRTGQGVEDIAFQLIDLPPLSEQHVEAWMIDLVRHADLVWLVVDGPTALEGFDEARRVLEARGVGLFPAGSSPAWTEGGPRVLKPALVVVSGLDKPGVAESIETVEGIAKANHPLIEAYIKHSCMQCGFCTPGFVVTAKALLDRNPDPTVDEIKEAMVGNLCRCGTYPAHIKAIQEAAAVLKTAVPTEGARP